MGGDYYERDVEVAPVNNVAGYSNAAQKILSQNKSLSKGNDPKRFKDKKLQCNNKNPLVFALDVTGSMGDWSKVILNDFTLK